MAILCSGRQLKELYSTVVAVTLLLTCTISRIGGTEVELNGPNVCLYEGFSYGVNDFAYPSITKKCCDGFIENEEGNKCIPFCKYGRYIARTGACLCNDGFWGPACEYGLVTGFSGSIDRSPLEQRCDCLNEGTCDLITGICNCYGFFGVKCENKCRDGYYGTNCTQKCHCKNNAKCSRYDGSCECPSGFNGTFCEIGIKRCDCLNGGVCDPTTGICYCEMGFFNEKCENKCLDGYYGRNCSQKCHCKNHAKCKEYDGYCECLPGYKGTFCEIVVCPEGYFGQDCLQKPNSQGLIWKDSLPYLVSIILVVLSIIFISVIVCVLISYQRRNRDLRPTAVELKREQHAETTSKNDPTNLAHIKKFTSLKTTTESAGHNIYTPLQKLTPSREISNIVYCLTDTGQNDQYVEMSNPTATLRKEVCIDMNNIKGKVDDSYEQFEEHVYAEISYLNASKRKDEYDRLDHLGASNTVLNENYDQINDTKNKVQNKTKGQSLGHI